MSVAYNAFHSGRWGVFLLRWVLRCAYSMLQFFSKPGSRVIVPIALATITYLQRAIVHPLLGPIVDPYTDYTTQPWMLDTLLVLALIAFTLAYWIASRVLALMLAAFPQMARPLAPQRRFEATLTHSKSAPVSVVVPALPTRQAKVEAAT